MIQLTQTQWIIILCSLVATEAFGILHDFYYSHKAEVRMKKEHKAIVDALERLK